MSCPFGKNSTSKPSSVLYADYLKLDQVLSAQKLISGDKNGDNVAKDEHLFIIIHQTYELWFKEILFGLEIVRGEFSKENPLISAVIKRLNRIVMILKLLVDQILILETMTPMDFNDFRKLLNPASGFQSMQFRLIENTLGLRPENRSIKFNQNFQKIFKHNQVVLNGVEKSVSAPSILQLLGRWLENTPHLDVIWGHYKNIVETKVIPEVLLDNGDMYEGDDNEYDNRNDIAIKRAREMFDSIFDSTIHDALVQRGERKMSLKALQGAIVIHLYKDNPVYASSNQVLRLLVDIDTMISRWRYNHVLLIQRMIGPIQVGTGGSSGYQYLRSTLSDRLKPFVDLANLASFLVQQDLLKPLDELVDDAANPTQGNCPRIKGDDYNDTEHENGGKHCLNCKNKSDSSTEKLCSVCIQSECKIDVVDVKLNNGIRGFGESGNSASEDERKEFDNSYESTSSISSIN